MSKQNYVHVEWDSAFFTDLNMMINFVYSYHLMSHKDDLAKDLLLYLRNTQARGYELVRKKKVAIKKKKS